MKFKTTQKAVKEGYRNIIRIGYCELQHLLNYQSPVAYNCGVYGWNADVYDIDGVTICTGYRPFGNISPKYQLVRSFDEKARQIVNSREYSQDEKKEMVNKLLNEFIEKVLGE